MESVIENVTLVKKKKRSKAFSKSNLTLLGMCVPVIIFMIIFNYIPMIGVTIAFKDFRYDLGFLNSEWVGFKNFEFFFKSDGWYIVLRNTIGMNLLFITFGMFTQICLALLMNELRKKLFIKVYQTILFFPYFLSWVVISYIVYAFLSPTSGYLNTILGSLGMDQVMWYDAPEYWVTILVILQVWKGMGYGTILYYSALLGVDPEYYDAASIDGANKFQQIWHISIPFLKPMMTIILILSIGHVMNADFGLFYQVTLNSGRLLSVTEVVNTFVYRALTQTGDVGMASATGLFQSFVGFILVFGSNMVVKKINPENSFF